MTLPVEDSDPKIAPGLIWRTVDDNLVVVSPEGGDIHVLSQTGAEIWRLLSEGQDVSTIESYLVQKYVVSAEQARYDVTAFIAELRVQGLVR